jgi:neutral ceramidase
VYAERILQMQREWPDKINIILQTFRIGDLGVAAIPFEVFTETGWEIKKKSPYKSTFTIELANGSFGYLPTPEQHELGGYETWLGTNKVEKNASRKIVAELLALFSSLK